MMSNLPPLKALTFFNQVAQTKHFARAANILNVTPGAVSQQIKQLERFLGCQLLVRNTKNVELTNQGENYFKDIHRALSIIESATDRIHPQANQSIQIQLMATLALQWLIPNLNDFYTQHPDININLMTSADADSSIDLNRVDFSIQLADHRPNAEAQKLWEDELVLVYSPLYFTDSNIHTATSIYVNHRFRKYDWQHYCEQASFSANDKVLYLTSTAQAIKAAINGVGALVTHLPLVYPLIQEEKLTIYQSPIKNSNAYYLVEGNTLWQNPSKRAVKDWLLAQAEKYF